MTVGVENTNSASDTSVGGVSSISIANALTITTANALAVVMAFPHSTSGPSGTITVTWDSGGTNQIMTQVHGLISSGAAVYIYGLLAPTTGTKTLAVSWTGANSVNYGLGLIGLTGVDQTAVTSSFRNFNDSIVSGLSDSINVSTSATDGSIAVATDTATGAATGINNTTLFNISDTNNGGEFVGQYAVPSGVSFITFSYNTGAALATYVYTACDVAALGSVSQTGLEQISRAELEPHVTTSHFHVR